MARKGRRSDSSSSEDGRRREARRHPHSDSDDGDMKTRRDVFRDSESEGSPKEHDRQRKRHRSDADNREKGNGRRDEKRNYGSRHSGIDSEIDDDKRSRNLRNEETTKENGGQKSRKDDRDRDRDRDRKLRHNEANENEDHREIKPRRHRDYDDSKSDRRRRSEHGREDDDSKSDRRRRSEHGREDDEEEGEYRVGEGRSNKYDNREDGRKERRRDREQERDKRREENDDKHGRRSEKDRKASETVNVNVGLNPKGEVKENVGFDAVANSGRSGGVYIPPFKLARMMKEVEDKSSVEYQRMTWDALRKSINGLVNKVNATNIKNIIPELFAENLIRGRGLFCRSCMKSQMASPGFTDVFAALVAVVNTKFPEVGDLLLRRIILQLQRAYKRNDKVCILDSFCLFSCSF